MSSVKNDSENPPANKNDEGDKKRKRFEEDGSKVLIYDYEAGDTTHRFVDALKNLLPEFELNNFHDADDEKKDTLPIIAVVRYTSIRTDECLRQIIERLDKDDVKDMKRVIIIYFCMNGSEKEEISNGTRVMYNSEAFRFKKIVQMDFTDYKLEPNWIVNQCRSSFLNKIFRLNEQNEMALKELKDCLKMRSTRTNWDVKVYYEMDESIVKQFVAELRQNVKSSIHIQDAQPKEELKKVTSVILFLTNGHEKLEISDLKKVILFKIDTSTGSKPDDPNSTENASSITKQKSNSAMLSEREKENALQHAENESCQEYGQIWEVTYINGQLKFVMNFLKEFENFVRTC